VEHREHLMQVGKDELKRREELRVRNQLLDLLKETLMEKAMSEIGGMKALDRLVDEIVDRKRDPYGVNFELVERLLGGGRH
jgi:hypothetical protein